MNRQISEALTLRTGSVASAVRGRRPPRVSKMLKTSTDAGAARNVVDPSLLATVPAFRHFTAVELEVLGSRMQQHALKADTLLFTEGDPGASCYVLLSGAVDVSIKVRGQAQLLSQLGPGSIFGQVSLIQGEPRSASCSIHKDAVLAEFDRTECESLLSDRSAIALKLFAALNEGLVEALRSADRQLMRLEGEREGGRGNG